MSGAYSVGGAGSSYPTVAAAAAALSSNGVNGPVVFDISPGTYTGNILVGPIQGASATNTIVFQSTTQDSTDVLITHPSGTSTTDNYALRLNGASFVTFRYLTFQRTGTNNYTQVIDIINGSHYITFTHNRITGVPATTAATYQALVYGANNSSNSNIVLDENRFENGSYGIWLLGMSQLPCCVDVGNKVLNNHFTGQHHCAVMLSYQGGPQIIGNTIEGTSTANGFGIYTFFCDNDLQIQRNKISIINGRGIYVHNAAITGYPENLIANNFIAVGGSLASSGITLENSRYCNLYYNSVNIYNPSQAGTAFRIEGIGSGFNNLKNNIFMNSGGGFAVYVSTSTSSPLLSSDFNNLYATDTLLGFWQTAGNQPSVAAYASASGMEQNSVSMDPLFASQTDLHCTSLLMNNLGNPVASTATPVTEDIDSQPRHPFTPDIGADEYSFISLALAGLDTVSSFCEGSFPAIRVQVENLSSQMFQDSLLLGYQFQGFPREVAWYHMTILPYDTVNVILSGTATMPGSGGYILTVDLAHPEDLDATNDTMQTTVQVAAKIIVDLGNDFLLCMDDLIPVSTNLAIQADYLWHDSSTDPVWIADAGQMGAGFHQVWVNVTNINHCSWSDTLVIQVVDLPKPVIEVQPSFKALIGGDSVTVVCKNLTNFFSCGAFSTYLWNGTITDSRFPARIDELFVNFTGVTVAKGEHLARIYSPELISAHQELRLAHAADPDGSITRAVRAKLRLWDLLPEQVDAILAQDDVADDFELRAPTGGVVVTRNIKEGDYVKTGEPLFGIADLSELWLHLQAFESDLAKLRYGQEVGFTVEAWPGETFTGRIAFIAPDVDKRTRTVPVRVNVPNPDARLKPGMFARGQVRVKLAGDNQVFAPDLAGKWISPMHPEIVKAGPGACDVCGM
ncbi:MAG: efflux RND transporter periplasmic adaptor subunit, partial [Bacteroidales bacterium]